MLETKNWTNFSLKPEYQLSCTISIIFHPQLSDPQTLPNANITPARPQYFYLPSQFGKLEYENWEWIQFHATIVFVVLRFYQDNDFAIHTAFHFFSFLFSELMAGMSIVRQCWVNLLLAIKGEMQFTWIILPERSRCQRYAVQACRIIPIFLALRWNFSTRRSLGTCAVCFVIARRIPFAIFAIGAIAFLLRVAAAIAIFLARLWLGGWRVVVVIDGRVVVFWEKTCFVSIQFNSIHFYFELYEFSSNPI